jgi:hypothetical protein
MFREIDSTDKIEPIFVFEMVMKGSLSMTGLVKKRFELLIEAFNRGVLLERETYCKIFD